MSGATNAVEKGTFHVRVRVTAGAAKERFVQTGAREFEAYVREPAQKNMANRRVCALVAEHYGVEPREVRLITGHRSRSKGIEVAM